jgi:uncharacterized membrane protein YecN with MAPEG domain
MYVKDGLLIYDNTQTFNDDLIGIGHIDSRGRVKTRQKSNPNIINYSNMDKKLQRKIDKTISIKIPKWLTIPIGIILYFYLFMEHTRFFGILNTLGAIMLIYYLVDKSIRFRRFNFFIKFLSIALICIYTLFFGLGAIFAESDKDSNTYKENHKHFIETAYNK